jgi:hypothetical protein
MVLRSWPRAAAPGERVCLEFTELLHSAEIGNHTPGSVVEFDKVKFGGYLEAIVDTFTFMPK